MAEKRNYESVPGFGEEIVNTGRDPVICANCVWNSGTPETPYCKLRNEVHSSYWFCADGVAKYETDMD